METYLITTYGLGAFAAFMTFVLWSLEWDSAWPNNQKLALLSAAAVLSPAVVPLAALVALWVGLSFVGGGFKGLWRRVFPVQPLPKATAVVTSSGKTRYI